MFLTKKKELRQKQIEAKIKLLVQNNGTNNRDIPINLNTSNLEVSQQSERAGDIQGRSQTKYEGQQTVQGGPEMSGLTWLVQNLQLGGYKPIIDSFI